MKVHVSLKRVIDDSHDIFIDEYPVDGIGAYLSGSSAVRKYLIFTDTNVMEHYGGRLTENLRANGLDVPEPVVIPAGEQSKSNYMAFEKWRELVRKGAARDSSLIAIGGGVVTDLGGFIASSYMRGIPPIYVLTTLMAMVDAGIGGKTGFDLPEGKNLVGAFYQPKAIFIDTGTLKTLPEREFRSGSAEAIKYGLISDAGMLQFLEEHIDEFLALDKDVVGHVVNRSCEIKAGFVSKDEKEKSGLRALLNYGHTFGHPLEAATGYSRFTHGEAVSIGMVQAAELSRRCGYLDAESVGRQNELLARAGLPVKLPADIRTEDLMRCMKTDKKSAGGKKRFVILHSMGDAVVQDGIDDVLVEEVIDSTRAH